MRVVNYDKEMLKTIEQLKKSGEKATLLLHACCAPCASYPIEILKDALDLTVYFYNPNMDTQSEYNLRAEELRRFCKEFNVNCVIEAYNSQEFLDMAKGLENEFEGGSRCKKCFRLRLEKSAEYAKLNGFDYFATTLTVSPLKNAKILNDIGLELQQEKGVNYLCTDFKKRNGYIRSTELSRQYDLYRQNYCGCIYSKNSTI